MNTPHQKARLTVHGREQIVATLKPASRAPGVDEIFGPGEMEARADAAACAEGLVLPRDVAAERAACVARLGLAAPFA